VNEEESSDLAEGLWAPRRLRRSTPLAR